MNVTAPTFDDLLAEQVVESAEDNFDIVFARFINRHPHVWTEIVRIIAQAKDRGQSRISMKWVFEAIRQTVPREGRPVALNNNWTAPASRRLISERPDLAPLLHVRKRKS